MFTLFQIRSLSQNTTFSSPMLLLTEVNEPVSGVGAMAVLEMAALSSKIRFRSFNIP